MISSISVKHTTQICRDKKDLFPYSNNSTHFLTCLCGRFYNRNITVINTLYILKSYFLQRNRLIYWLKKRNKITQWNVLKLLLPIFFIHLVIYSFQIKRLFQEVLKYSINLQNWNLLKVNAIQFVYSQYIIQNKLNASTYIWNQTLVIYIVLMPSYIFNINLFLYT